MNRISYILDNPAPIYKPGDLLRLPGDMANILVLEVINGNQYKILNIYNRLCFVIEAGFVDKFCESAEKSEAENV